MNMFRPTTLVLAVTMALIAAGCGKKNESGKSSYNPYSNYLGQGAALPAGANSYASLVFNGLPCSNGQQRIGVQFGLNMAAAANSTYVGITSEGDIAVVTSNAGQAVFSAYICNRPEFASTNGQGSMSANPAIGRSLVGCAVDEISAASLRLPTMYGYYLTLNFRPIHYGVPGYTQFNQVLTQLGCRY